MSVTANGIRSTLNLAPAERHPPIRLSTAERFFLEGDEQEASGYQNVIWDDDLVASRDLEFDSFDKIPRKRRSLVVLAAVSVTFVIGVAAWTRGGVPQQHAPGRSTIQETASAIPVRSDGVRASDRIAIEAPAVALSLQTRLR